MYKYQLPETDDIENERVKINLDKNLSYTDFVYFDSETRKIIVNKQNVTQDIDEVTIGVTLSDESKNRKRYSIKLNFIWINDTKWESRFDNRAFTANITDISVYGLVTVKFSSELETRFFNLTNYRILQD